MKKNYQKFRELMKNPRYKALFKLLFWFIFFGILYLIISTGISPSKYSTSTKSNTNKITKNSIENYKNMNSFEYTYTFNYKDNDNKKTIVAGTYFNDKYYFTIGENNYYFSDSLYLVLKDKKQLIENPKIDLPISLTEINYLVIYNWVNGSEKDSEVTYNDNSKIIEYIYNVEDSYKIYIDVYEKDYLIESIDLNLVDFLATKNLNFDEFTVHIEYKNINNISSYERNYNEYEIIHESV